MPLPSTIVKAIAIFDRGMEKAQRMQHAQALKGSRMTEERIVQLEILVAEQERTIAELSNELAEQWKVVNVLERKLNALINRFLELEEQSAPEVPITQPPHW